MIDQGVWPNTAGQTPFVLVAALPSIAFCFLQEPALMLGACWERLLGFENLRSLRSRLTAWFPRFHERTGHLAPSHGDHPPPCPYRVPDAGRPRGREKIFPPWMTSLVRYCHLVPSSSRTEKKLQSKGCRCNTANVSTTTDASNHDAIESDGPPTNGQPSF